MGYLHPQTQFCNQNNRFREDLQACRICGRWFTRHVRDRVCSRDCLVKLKEEKKS
jgi:hypothetical protein